MDDQPKVRAQSASPFFYNGASMRDPVPGTVAIGGLKEDVAFFTGKGADGQFVSSPVAMDEKVVERGRQRYRIYCQPCHDPRGDGKGILFQRGSVPTASFHQEKILKYTDGQIFDVITNGQGLMSGYKWPIPPADRWAIIAYVRLLQREQVARAAAAAASRETSGAGATPDKPPEKPAEKTPDKPKEPTDAELQKARASEGERVGGSGGAKPPGINK
jgi:mono/diheme cytochrome c family protein